MTDQAPPPPPPERQDTERLALAAARGEAPPFALLYERIAPALYTWADLRIRPSLRAWVEPGDIVQEVWCRALEHIERFDQERTSFRYWVFRVAKNVLLEATRKAGKHGPGAPAPGSTARQRTLDGVPDSISGVSHRLSRDESLQRFHEWIRELDEADRELLLHHGLEGMTHAQVSVRLQIGEEAATKRWQRLRHKIEQQAIPKELLSALAD
jgi:RNA polymerase sigma factor (sigma-70 family)